MLYLYLLNEVNCNTEDVSYIGTSFYFTMDTIKKGVEPNPLSPPIRNPSLNLKTKITQGGKETMTTKYKKHKLVSYFALIVIMASFLYLLSLLLLLPSTTQELLITFLLGI